MYMGGGNSKSTFDPYTGTEYQHDFYHYGFKIGTINHPESENYKEYVDDNHLHVVDKEKDNTWCYTDDGLLNTITGNSKAQLQNIDDGFNMIITSPNGRKTYNYIINKQSASGKVGSELAIALGIKDHSIVIVDTDNGIIKSRFKKASGGDENFSLYYFMHPIVSSDSAGKTNYATDKVIFTNSTGVIGSRIMGSVNCYALMSRQELLLTCNNNQLAMDYKVRIKPSGATEVSQEWIPNNRTGKTFTKTKFLNANKNNNRGSCGEIARKLIKNNNNIKERASYNDSKHTFDDAILALMRKRSGDLFQGFLTKHFKRITNGIRVRQYSRAYNTNKPTRPLEIDHNNRQSFSIQKILDKAGDILTVTGDYPYLTWCLENGVNVLFRAPGTQNIFYFKIQQ